MMLRSQIIQSYIQKLEEDPTQQLHLYQSWAHHNNPTVYCTDGEYSCAVPVQDFITLLLEPLRPELLGRLLDRLEVEPISDLKQRLALYQLLGET